MKKKEKNEKNSWLRSFFELEARPEGKFRGQVPCTEVLEPLGYRGGGKTCEKSSKFAIKWIKMSNDHGSHYGTQPNPKMVVRSIEAEQKKTSFSA